MLLIRLRTAHRNPGKVQPKRVLTSATGSCSYRRLHSRRTPKAQAISENVTNASAVLTMTMRVMRPLSAP
jgi:hypothetical protein